jgi:hypothetical protein
MSDLLTTETGRNVVLIFISIFSSAWVRDQAPAREQ